jgi:glycosyltransferase involved in cell wall biosynthesis
MRALIYNWVQFDVAGEGGGVSVYLRQTIPALVERHGWQVTVLSSGRAYDAFNRRCRHRRTRNALEHLGVRSFEIVNSPVKAPAHDSFSLIDTCLDDRTVASAFVAMMQETGPYDIVVLHNVEGISTLTLEWIKQRTGAALVLFLHNYHLVCPQIELLRDFRDHCENDHEGRGCVGCFSHVVDARKAKMARAVIEIMDRTRVSGTVAERIVRSTAAHGYGWTRDVAGSLRDMARRKAPGSLAPRWRRSMDALDRKSAGIELWSRAFRRWRPENAARVNACADAIITVSDRERDQLAARGIAAALMTTVHPGFDFHVMAAERRRRYEAKTRYDGPLRLGFLGYAIPSKGLELLIEALADAGPWAREMELWIVCRHDERLHRRLARLGDRLAAIRWIDGYSREELPEILAGIDLGIIPSICFETYSITAYEFTMAGVPVVMSDSVGFEELVDKPDFRFRRGDRAALRDTLQRLVADRRRIAEYWEGADRIPSLDDHLARFLAVVETARSRAGQDAPA